MNNTEQIQANRRDNQHQNESICAFIDAELTTTEASDIIDKMIKDPEFKAKYQRLQLANDSLQEQLHSGLVNKHLPKTISTTLDELPAHFSDNAVDLQPVETGEIKQHHWFKKLLSNKVVSGVSVAASVMFVTLLTMQQFTSNSAIEPITPGTIQSAGNQFNQPQQTTPSLIQDNVELPVELAATAAGSAEPDKSNSRYEQYRWVEADPELSQKVRLYLREHETHRPAYNIQPKIRTATYQMSE